MPEKFIEQVEVKRVDVVSYHEDEIRDHLQFARTIPSFVMAYGNQSLTLDNFDTFVPEHVFMK